MDFKKLHTALALANSMIESGEQHSETSKELIGEALGILGAKVAPRTELTFGEMAVGIDFNVGNDPAVHQAKSYCADAIDQMNDFRNLPSTSQGQKRHASTAITMLEDAQMRMVKGLTFKY